MSNRPNTTRRPNRRQLDPTNVNVPGIAVHYSTPGIAGPNTVITLQCFATRGRVEEETNPANLTLWQMWGDWTGVVEARTAASVRGEPAQLETDPTDLVITFVGVLDTTKRFVLKIPSSTPLFQSSHGGRLTGFMHDGFDPGTSPEGFLLMTNAEDFLP